MNIDWIATLVSALSSFALGAVWYSPLLFGKRWMADNNMTEADASANPARVFGTAFAFTLISAVVFGYFMQGHQTLLASLHAGVLIGIGLVAASFGLSYAFERRPMSLLAINGGYHIAQFTLYGLIFGLL